MNAAELHHLDTHQLREMVQSLQAKVQATESALTFKQAVIDKITHEMAVLKRMKFGAKAERYSPEQISLLEEAVEADLEALASEMDRLAPGKQAVPDRQTARRIPLPTHLPRWRQLLLLRATPVPRQTLHTCLTLAVYISHHFLGA